MTRKRITLEFVVPTLLAIVLSIGAVHLIDNYLGPVDQAEANYSAAGRDWFAEFGLLWPAGYVDQWQNPRMRLDHGRRLTTISCESWRPRPQLKSDRYPDEPDRNCRPFTCQTAAGNFEKNRAEAIADGLKAKGKW
jgi:hypothetical protein